MAKARALSDDQIRAIRKRYKATKKLSTQNPDRVTLNQLAAEFKSNRNSIWRIVNYYTYTDVEDEYVKDIGPTDPPMDSNT